jgi:hypothetical protein
MTSNRTDGPRKLGPWESLAALFIVLVMLFAFIAGFVALLKWVAA